MTPAPLARVLSARPWQRGVRAPARSGRRARAARAVGIATLSGVLLAGSWAGARSVLSGSGAAVEPGASGPAGQPGATAAPAAPVETGAPGATPGAVPSPGRGGAGGTDVPVAATPGDLPDGWSIVEGSGYRIGLPDGWLVVDRKAARHADHRRLLEAQWPFDAQVIAGLAARVSDDRLDLVAVEMPWRAGATTVTIRALPGPLRLDDVVETVKAAGADGARPIFGDRGFAFRFDTRSGDGADARALATGLLPLGSGRHLVLEVSADATEATTARALADAIVETFRSP